VKTFAISFLYSPTLTCERERGEEKATRREGGAEGWSVCALGTEGEKNDTLQRHGSYMHVYPTSSLPHTCFVKSTTKKEQKHEGCLHLMRLPS